jgi:hypothetical protein
MDSNTVMSGELAGRAMQGGAARPQADLLGQAAAQAAQTIDGLAGWVGRAEGHGDDVEAPAGGGAADVLQGRLGAQGDATGAFRRDGSLDHQQAQHVLFFGEGGQHHHWPSATGHCVGADGRSQDVLDLFGIQMFFRHLHLAAQPGITHQMIERRDHLTDKALQPELHQQLLQAATQVFMEMQAHELEDGGELGRAFRVSAVPGLADFVEHAHQRLQFEIDDLGGAHALINQAPEQAKLVHLGQRIDPLAVGVPRGLRKAVAAFPDAQCVLGQTGVTFDCGDGQTCWLEWVFIFCPGQNVDIQMI